MPSGLVESQWVVPEKPTTTTAANSAIAMEWSTAVPTLTCSGLIAVLPQKQRRDGQIIDVQQLASPHPSGARRELRRLLPRRCEGSWTAAGGCSRKRHQSPVSPKDHEAISWLARARLVGQDELGEAIRP